MIQQIWFKIRRNIEIIVLRKRKKKAQNVVFNSKVVFLYYFTVSNILHGQFKTYLKLRNGEKFTSNICVSVKPMLQVQLYEALVLIHVAFKSQSLLVGSEHSSMSEMEKIARVFGNL